MSGDFKVGLPEKYI